MREKGLSDVVSLTAVKLALSAEMNWIGCRARSCSRFHSSALVASQRSSSHGIGNWIWNADSVCACRKKAASAGRRGPSSEPVFRPESKRSTTHARRPSQRQSGRGASPPPPRSKLATGTRCRRVGLPESHKPAARRDRSGDQAGRRTTGRCGSSRGPCALREVRKVRRASRRANRLGTHCCRACRKR